MRVRVAGLLRLRVAEVRGEPLVGLLADRARVEDEHVGFVGRRGLAEPELLEQATDALGIVRVHLTTERRDVVPPHGGSVRRRGCCTLVTVPSPTRTSRGATLNAGGGTGWPLGAATSDVAVSAVRGYFANSMARDSRMTVTLICPGYSRCCSISRAISCDSSAASSSAISSGFTITRTSRPACNA